MSRYLTKLCDQLVCLLSAEHSQAIVWGDGVDDLADASLDLENDDSDRLFNFEVAKTHEQEENVIARQGFQVQYLITHAYPPVLTFDRRSSQAELFTPCHRTLATQNSHRPKRIVSQATLWGNNAGLHDCPFPACEGDGRTFFSRPPERFPDSSPFVSVFQLLFSKLS